MGKILTPGLWTQTGTTTLVFGDGEYFSRTRLPNEPSEMAIGLLIDESGSMSSLPESQWHSKLQSFSMISVVLCISQLPFMGTRNGPVLSFIPMQNLILLTARTVTG